MFDRDLFDRLRSKIEPELNTGCWLWPFDLTALGYGKTYDRKTKRHAKVHRLMWRAVHGKVPNGQFVCHRCDTPACCNPDHLWLGTCAHNNSDKLRKGRQVRGLSVGNARLNPTLVAAIRHRVSSGESQTDVANALGVGRSTVQGVLTGRTWSHV